MSIATNQPNTQLSPVQKKAAGIRDLLAKARDQIAVALPRHMTAERMVRVTMTAVQRTPALLDCEPLSLIGAIVQASQLGLEPDGVLGHAYLVPFNNHKTGRKEVQLIPGYKGLVELTRRSGQISTINAYCVYAEDQFDFAYGLHPKLSHVPSDKDDPGPMIAVYAVCRLRDGGVQFEVMWRKQIDRIRLGSKAKDNGPWVTHYDEMAKKTVLRRLCKLLPVSVELQRAVALYEHADAGVSQHMATAVDFGTLSLPEPASRLDELTNRITDQTNGATPEASVREPGDETEQPVVQEFDATTFYGNLDRELNEATAILPVAGIMGRYLEAAPDDETKMQVQARGDARRDAIRANRGDKGAAEKGGA